MSQKKKGFCFFNLRLPFSKPDRLSGCQQDGISSPAKPTLNEEYRSAFRTNSYIEICTKIQSQIQTETSLDGGEYKSYIHLSQDLLEPQSEALNSRISSSSTHRLILMNYFDVSLEACRTCKSLLEDIHQVRNNHSAIKAVIMSPKWGQAETYRNYLNSFSLQKNPFSAMTAEKFHQLHGRHQILLQKLTSQCRKKKRRSELIKFMKRATAGFLVMGCGALAIAVLILTVHTMAVAPSLVMCALIMLMAKRLRQADRGIRWKERWSGQLDVAARGVYIMINDFDTMSRLVRRLDDEMEHRRFVADVCLRKGKSCEMVKEVVREFEGNEECFQEQLEELERQVYLCFLDINRSRRLLVREMGNR